MYWPKLEKLLAPVLAEEGLYLAAHVLVEHAKGGVQIWIAARKGSDEIDVEAVMVSRVMTYPLKKLCAVPYIAGKNMVAWKDKFIASVEHYARSQGCTEMSGGYRKGWARAAGYEITGVNLRKVLTNGS